MGATTVCTDSGCVAAELWESVDTFPIGNVTMETDDFYVNSTNMANAVPIIDVDTLTPFGESHYSQARCNCYAVSDPGPPCASCRSAAVKLVRHVMPFPVVSDCL